MVVHLRTQRHQPFGSVRLCCEMCGRAHPRVVGVADDPEYTHETDDPDLYANHPYRCSLPEHMRGVEGEQLSLPFNS